ncbi:flagellar biosynthesis regulator FlaF [Magnetospirillum sp. UT-4]|uniref:flagellar biosynthesis regulator FlaF n=1 Tax=Magnetospirillum sp. UT-4 TaxID=2681467 RepID=UPI0013843FDB|nr:flagellar biosynthesis regulator FlaF [Magnetospirillum sp. UT-4]CAA7618403.1 conserved hypothetical protein [Magnetospirillum sp. UT-4]
MDDTSLSLVEEQAFQLSRCAIALDNAREAKDLGVLVAALNDNLEVWVAIRSLVMAGDCSLTAETKDNLKKLSEFVAAKTFEGVEKLSDDGIRSLVNINLQISEGMLEGAKA